MGEWGDGPDGRRETNKTFAYFAIFLLLISVRAVVCGGARAAKGSRVRAISWPTRWMEWPRRNQSRLLMRAAGMFRAVRASSMYAVLGIQRETRTRKTENGGPASLPPPVGPGRKGVMQTDFGYMIDTSRQSVQADFTSGKAFTQSNQAAGLNV